MDAEWRRTDEMEASEAAWSSGKRKIVIVSVKESIASKMSLEPKGKEGQCCLKKQEH